MALLSLLTSLGPSLQSCCHAAWHKLLHALKLAGCQKAQTRHITLIHILKGYGITYAAYKEARMARWLLSDDHMQGEIMKDAATYKMSHQLRQTFVLLLLWDEPADSLELWGNVLQNVMC